MMFLLTVILIVFCCTMSSTLLTDIYSLPKCCEIDQYVLDRDQTLQCKFNQKKRLEILTGSYNYLNGNSEGECIDSDNVDFYVYKLKNSKLDLKQPLKQDHFRKCCPLGMVYNPTYRSCIHTPNANESWINGTLLKIGLPHCKLILDTIISNVTDLSNVTLDKNFTNFCLDQDPESNLVVRECEADLSLCENTRCIRKCCPDGQSFVGGGKCFDTHQHGFNIYNTSFTNYIENPNDHFELIYNTACTSFYWLQNNKISYTITNDGVWRYYSNYTKSFIEELYDHSRSYCIEHAQKGTLSDFLIFECIDKVPPALKFGWTFFSKMLSCVLLVATVVIYIIMGEVKNPFGKILMNYCTAMFFLIVILLVAHTHVVVERLECKLRSYFIIIFNSALYAWLNIMSLDIWWTFGSPKRTIGQDQRQKEIKKMLLYCLYGWGFPLVHALIILLFDMVHVLPEVIQPYIGIYFCYMEARNYARHVFILLPLGIIQIVNTVHFIKTATYCIKVKNEINKMNDTSRGAKETSRFMQNKDRLGLIVKLAVIMGVIFTFELISACFNLTKTKWQYFEVFMDNIVCLQGVYIFIIFICKKKTIDFFKHKRYAARQRKTSCSTSFSSQLHNTTAGSFHAKNGSMQIKNGKL